VVLLWRMRAALFAARVRTLEDVIAAGAAA